MIDVRAALRRVRGLSLAGSVCTSILLTLWSAPAFGQACQRWVALPGSGGSDANPGTLAQPWATLDHASASIPDNSCTVWFADGVYTGTHSLYERFATPTLFRSVNRYKAIFEFGGTAVKVFGGRNMTFQGFVFRHTGAGAGGLVVQVQMDGVNWAERITFRDNIFHDSWNNDLLKINNGARFITVENNVFYNQNGSDEHMDVNSVTDVLIRDNIFFNDFAGSGRVNANDTSSYIVIKDSNAGDDGQIGSHRITVRRNVFLNWEGSSGSNFVLIGEDGMPYFEGEDIAVENNLMIGNSANDMRAAFGVKGGKNITFRHNTVTGNLPALAYAMRLNREGANPVNENVSFRGNIWCDPTGTMGATAGGGGNDFSDGDPTESTGALLDRNLYWNGPTPIPAGDVFSPLLDDARRIVANPALGAQAGVVLPRWNGTSFLSGQTTIRGEFERLVGLYGAIAAASPADGQGDHPFAPDDDILGRPRPASPAIGAYEPAIPVTAAIAPTSGPAAGGTQTTLTGTGFQTGATVTAEGVAATQVFVAGPGFAVATMPALTPGSLNDVVLTNPDTSSVTLPDAFLADFLDVSQAHPFHDFVEALVRGGVTAGCTGGNYCPDSSVTREQMAVFLLRSNDGPAYTPPACTVPAFGDVPCSSVYAVWINELVARSVTAGCGGGNYCPADAVTREQMAVFLLRTFEGPTYTPPACVTPTFVDVPCSSGFARWIEELVLRNITAGCGGGLYCPLQAVSRGQMAVFLTETFGLP